MAALPEIIHSRAHIAPEVLDLLNECMRNNVDKLLESKPEKTEDISEKPTIFLPSFLGFASIFLKVVPVASPSAAI